MSLVPLATASISQSRPGYRKLAVETDNIGKEFHDIGRIDLCAIYAADFKGLDRFFLSNIYIYIKLHLQLISNETAPPDK